MQLSARVRVCVAPATERRCVRFVCRILRRVFVVTSSPVSRAAVTCVCEGRGGADTGHKRLRSGRRRRSVSCGGEL